MKMLRDKPPSTAMSERCEQVKCEEGAKGREGVRA